MKVGVFDSGIGGLSVLSKIRERLPQLDLIYVADSLNIPYGTKSAAFIQDRSRRITQSLIDQGCEAVVVACNTATAAAISVLREEFSIPFVGIEPAVKPAIHATNTGVVGVLATQLTLESRKFSELLQKFRGDIEVVIQPCPKWVWLVEEGKLTGEEVESASREYLQPLLDKNCDVAVLGCTHFPFLMETIVRLAPSLNIVEPGNAVAARLEQVLLQHYPEDKTMSGTGLIRFETTGNLDIFSAQIRLLWKSVHGASAPAVIRNA